MINKIVFTTTILVFITLIVNGQNKSLGMNLYASNYLDAIKDTEYNYETVTDGNLTQISFVYSNFLKDKITYNIAAGFSSGGGIYRNNQIVVGTGSTDDRTAVVKDKSISFLKLGIGTTYWFSSPHRGAFLTSEVLINALISANSRDMIKVDNAPWQEFDLDFKDELNGFVPLLKFGIGYNLNVGKGFYLNTGLFFDLRIGSYFKDSDNYNFLNRGLQFGIGYVIS